MVKITAWSVIYAIEYHVSIALYTYFAWRAWCTRNVKQAPTLFRIVCAYILLGYAGYLVVHIPGLAHHQTNICGALVAGATIPYFTQLWLSYEFFVAKLVSTYNDSLKRAPMTQFLKFTTHSYIFVAIAISIVISVNTDGTTEDWSDLNTFNCFYPNELALMLFLGCFDTCYSFLLLYLFYCNISNVQLRVVGNVSSSELGNVMRRNTYAVTVSVISSAACFGFASLGKGFLLRSAFPYPDSIINMCCILYTFGGAVRWCPRCAKKKEDMYDADFPLPEENTIKSYSIQMTKIPGATSEDQQLHWVGSLD